MPSTACGAMMHMVMTMESH